MIKASQFSFSYSEQIDEPIFRNASFEITAGSVTAVIGPNGSGKTTLFEIILGTLKPTHGEIVVLAGPSDCVIMPQSISAPGLLSVSEIVEFIFSINSIKKNAAQEFQSSLTESERKRYKKIQHRKFGICSAGERAWLLCSILLSLPRKLYILDEPTAGVDPEFRILIWNKIKRVAEKGATILVSTHLLDEVGAHSQRVIMISDSNLLSFPSMSELIESTGKNSADQAFMSLIERKQQSPV